MPARRPKAKCCSSSTKFFTPSDIGVELVPNRSHASRVKRGAEARRLIKKLVRSLPPGLQWIRVVCSDGVLASHECHNGTIQIFTITPDGTLIVSQDHRSHVLYESIPPEIVETPTEAPPVANEGLLCTPQVAIRHSLDAKKCAY